MPDWLIDPSSSTYLLLAVAAAGAAFYWFRTQTRKSGLIAAAVMALIAAWVALTVALESPREEAVRRVEAMIAAANRHDPRAVLPDVSDRFQYKGMTKAAFGSAHVWDMARQHQVRLAVWDFDRGYVERPDDKTLTFGFMLKVEGQQPNVGPFRGAFFVRPTFVHDPDGAWRLQTFALYSDPLQKSKGPEFVLPGVGPQ